MLLYSGVRRMYCCFLMCRSHRASRWDSLLDTPMLGLLGRTLFHARPFLVVRRSTGSMTKVEQPLEFARVGKAKIERADSPYPLRCYHSQWLYGNKAKHSIALVNWVGILSDDTLAFQSDMNGFIYCLHSDNELQDKDSFLPVLQAMQGPWRYTRKFKNPCSGANMVVASMKKK